MTKTWDGEDPAEEPGRVILVAGAGGFIGGHLTRALLDGGASRVVAVDKKPIHTWYQRDERAENRVMDLALREAAASACEGVTEIMNLAADMGGMGFIENNKSACMLNVLINTHLMEAAVRAGVERYFFASSACVYNIHKQARTDTDGLREGDAYPAMPEDGYGWEKLFSERMCQNFAGDFPIRVRIARFHNIYGPHGAFDGGREKAPAAVCRKVAEAQLLGRSSIDIWGDGRQTRSFTYIDDCLEGIQRICASDMKEPLNLGSSEQVSINDLVSIVEEIAGVSLTRNHYLDAPKGVRGRNSDNREIRRHLGWEPSTSLRVGMEQTYAWIHDQVARSLRREDVREGARGVS